MLTMPTKVFDTNEILFKEKDPSGDVYVVLSGRIEVSRKEDGEKRILATMGKDAVVGDMSLIKDEPRSTTVIALEKTECFVISITEFRNKLETLDPFMQAVYAILCGRLCDLNKKLAQQML